MTDAFIAIILSVIILVGITGPAITHGVINPFECKETVGTVVGKDDSEGFILYVELDYKTEDVGYKIYVSPAAYEKYDVGFSYTETTCDLVEYDKIQNILNNLIDAGVLEGIN